MDPRKAIPFARTSLIYSHFLIRVDLRHEVEIVEQERIHKGSSYAQVPNSKSFQVAPLQRF